MVAVSATAFPGGRGAVRRCVLVSSPRGGNRHLRKKHHQNIAQNSRFFNSGTLKKEKDSAKGVTRVDEAAWQQAEGGFAANGVHDFVHGVDGDAVELLHVFGCGVLELLAAIVGVETVFNLGGFLRKGLNV